MLFSLLLLIDCMAWCSISGPSAWVAWSWGVRTLGLLLGRAGFGKHIIHLWGVI